MFSSTKISQLARTFPGLWQRKQLLWCNEQQINEVAVRQILTKTLTEPLCRSKEANAFLNGVGVLGVMTDFRNTGVNDSDFTWLPLTDNLSQSSTVKHYL